VYILRQHMSTLCPAPLRAHFEANAPLVPLSNVSIGLYCELRVL
jgi:hypothetical protein